MEKWYFVDDLVIKCPKLPYLLSCVVLCSNSSYSFIRIFQAGKSTSEVVRDEINWLLSMKFTSRWPPVNKFMELGGITLMLKIIAFAYDWNYSGR